MTDAQTWTLIVGAFSAVIAALAALMRLTTHTMAGQFRAFEYSQDQRFKGLDQRFEAIDQRFEAIDQRFEAIDQQFNTVNAHFGTVHTELRALNTRIDRLESHMERSFDAQGRRIDRLDDDVSAIRKHLFGGPEAA